MHRLLCLFIFSLSIAAEAQQLVTGHGHVNYDAIAGVVYTQPEIASVGATEELLKESIYLGIVFPSLHTLK